MNDQDDQSALYKAAEVGHVEIVRLLLDKGANTGAIGNVSYHVYILLLDIARSM